MTRPAFVSAVCLAAGLLAAYAWWPPGVPEDADGDVTAPASATPRTAMPVPVATDGPRQALESRRVELRSLDRSFARTEEEALAAQRGDVGAPLDPDGHPIRVTAAPVADVGEFLDPEFAAPAPSPALGPTDVGEYMVPEERP